MASSLSKNLVIASLGMAGFVTVLALLDIAMQVPFAGATLMDILFILSAAVVGYLGWDAYKDIT